MGKIEVSQYVYLETVIILNINYVSILKFSSVSTTPLYLGYQPNAHPRIRTTCLHVPA